MRDCSCNDAEKICQIAAGIPFSRRPSHLPDAKRAVFAGRDEPLVVEGEPHLSDRVAVELVLRPIAGQRQRESEGLEERKRSLVQYIQDGTDRFLKAANGCYT